MSRVGSQKEIISGCGSMEMYFGVVSYKYVIFHQSWGIQEPKFSTILKIDLKDKLV